MSAKSKKTLNSFLCFLMLIMAPTLSYSKNTDETCSSLMDDVLNSSEQDTVEKKTELWRGHKTKCSNSDEYDLGLARIFLQAGMIKESRDAIQKIAVEKSSIKAQLEHVQADTRFYEILTQTRMTKEKLQEAFGLYETLVNKYPKYYGGYQGLGKLLLSAKQYEKSAKYSDHSIKLKPTFNAYRNLSLASFQLKKYKETTDAAKSAFLKNAAMLGDKKLMLAAATSYHELGENEKSLAVLQMLANKKPSLEKHQEVVFLKFKIEDARGNK